MKIKDNGDGWKVYAIWYGQERVVHVPSDEYGREIQDPFVALRNCNKFVKDYTEDGANVEVVVE